ncbi:MAG: nitroreductase family protein, partial [Pseudomonadota bacterium]
MNAPAGTELDALRAKAQENHRDLRDRIGRLSDDAIDLILRDARSHYKWTEKPIPDGLLEEIFEITINGATSMNTLPARFV